MKKNNGEIERLKNKIEKIKNRLLYYATYRDSIVRMEAMQALGIFYDGRIDDALLQGLKDIDELVRINALDNIILPKNPDKVFKKIAKLLQDESQLVQSYAIDALAYNNAKTYKKNIQKLLKRKNINDELKVSIYYALVKFGKKKYFKKLLDMLKHSNYRIRCATANLIYFIVDKYNCKKILKKLEKAYYKDNTRAAKSCIKQTIKDIIEKC
jgi:HEAT repeat protein